MITIFSASFSKNVFIIYLEDFKWIESFRKASLNIFFRYQRDWLRERYSGGGCDLSGDEGVHDGRPARVLLRQEPEEEGAQERQEVQGRTDAGGRVGVGRLRGQHQLRT